MCFGRTCNAANESEYDVRLFVAIELDESVRKALTRAQQHLKPSCGGVRWLPAAQLHLTLKFLGDVPDANVQGACEAIVSSTACCAPFDFGLSACGCFPPHGAVRIVWVGLNDNSGVLARCAEAIEASLETIGFVRERRGFSPHITIGRVREDRSNGRIRERAVAYSGSTAEQNVSSVALIQSVLSQQGPTYTVVRRAKLGKPD